MLLILMDHKILGDLVHGLPTQEQIIPEQYILLLVMVG